MATDVVRERSAPAAMKPAAQDGAKRRQRREMVVRALGMKLPTAALAGLFGVTPGFMRKLQSSLQVTVSPQLGTKQFQRFVNSELPPHFAILSEDEQRALNRTWLSLRLKTGVSAARRRDELVRAMNATVPTIVMARLLGVHRDTVSKCRIRLCLPGDHLEPLHYRYLNGSDSPPQFKILAPIEQQIFDEVWNGLRQEVRAMKALRRSRKQQRLVAQLAARLLEFSGQPLVRCKSKGCELAWVRHEAFFPKNSLSPDGLDSRCRVCEFLRRSDPQPKSARAKPRMISRDRKQYLVEVVRQNAKVLPGSVLRQLLGVNGNTLMQLRKEAQVTVSQPDSRRMLTLWLTSPDLPEVRGLNEEDSAELRLLWQHRYAASCESEDGSKV